MKVLFTDKEANVIKAEVARNGNYKITPFAMMKRLARLYEANLEEDIKSVIEMREEELEND